MDLPHGPEGVGEARRRLRSDLRRHRAPDTVVEDAALVLSELLSNAYRHGRPLAEDAETGIRVTWQLAEDGLLTLEITDGGGATRPAAAAPSLTAHGGRGLAIVAALALEWGVRDRPHEVTVWAVLPVRGRHARRRSVAARLGLATAVPAYESLFDDLG